MRLTVKRLAAFLAATLVLWISLGIGVVHRVPIAPVLTHRITVNADGTFTPSDVTVSVGDTVLWEGLGKFDSIVPVDDATNPCDPANAAPVGGVEDYLGPTRTYIPGIAVRGQGDDGGAIIIPDTDTCDCESGGNPCVPEQAGGFKFCGSQSGASRITPEVAAFPEVNVVLLIYGWNTIETSDGVYDWSEVQDDLRILAEEGKYAKITFSASNDTTPTFMFLPPTGTGLVTPVFTEDVNDGDPGPSNCGIDAVHGSIADQKYVDQVNQFITAFGAMVKADATLYNTVTAVHLMGVNNVSDEFKLPKSCLDSDQDGFLDRLNGDYCKCNTREWAVSGYTPQKLWDYTTAQAQLWHTVLGEHVDVVYAIIQGGLPEVDSTTNFLGDHLRWNATDPDPAHTPGACIVDVNGDNKCDGCTDSSQTNCTAGGKNDQKGSTPQMEGIISRGTAALGDRFRVSHYGIGTYPTEDVTKPASSGCSWKAPITLTPDPPHAVFPLTSTGNKNQEAQCPNSWVVEQGLLDHDHPTGWQVNNAGNGIDGADRHSSALWNITVNSNGAYIEFYQGQWWQIHTEIGSGVMDPLRGTDAVGDPSTDGPGSYDDSIDGAEFPKTIAEWAAELEGRRSHWPGVAFPSTFQHTWHTAGTYAFYNPRTCDDGAGGQLGHVTVVSDAGGTPTATEHVVDMATGEPVPADLTITQGDTVRWINLGRRDKITRVGPTGEVCDNPAAWGSVVDEFSTPRAIGVPGLWIKGGGATIQPLATPCPNGGTSRAATATEKFCFNPDPAALFYEPSWDYDWSPGLLCAIEWPIIEPDEGVFDFTLLDDCLGDALKYGKHVTLMFPTSGPELVLPEWLFDGVGNDATAVILQDEDAGTLGGQDCGLNTVMASPSDMVYRGHLKTLLSNVADHVESNVGWHQVVAQIQIPGMNFGGGENKVPKECPDLRDNDLACSPSGNCGSPDTWLDRYNGDDCVCNTKAWAEAGWTPEQLYAFYVDIGNAIHADFGADLTIGYPLIQAGFPLVASPTNYSGDQLFNTTGTARLCPTCTTGDDGQIPGGTKQTTTAITTLEGAFPGTILIQHNGLNRHPYIDGQPQNCSWARPIVGNVADFPIPVGTSVSQGGSCPNKWSNQAGVAGYFSGGQQESVGNGWDTPQAWDAGLWNLTQNSNYIRFEGYADWAWEIETDIGPTNPIDPTLTTLFTTPVTPKSVTQWNDELIARRRELATIPNLPVTGVADPYPEEHTHAFVATGTHRYTNPYTCLASGTGTVGTITVVP